MIPTPTATNLKPFANRITQLRELLLQSQKVFLLGAGCSKSAGLPITTELTERLLTSSSLDPDTLRILAAIQVNFEGASGATIEDYLSELIDLLTVADRRERRGATGKAITLGSDEYSVEQLRMATYNIKATIGVLLSRELDIRTHRDFVRAVHRPLRVGRTTPSQNADYIILNYDTAIEDSLALERIPFSDGMDGGATGWWNPATFERDDIVAKVIKLHGSINWCELPNDPLPRRVAGTVKLDDADNRRILIWPASTKYREAQLDPFAQLAHQARQSLRPPPGTQRLLGVCGYSFRDSHVNLEIDRALRESAGDLTMVVFTNCNAPSDQLLEWHEDPAINEQLLICANGGFYHADTNEESLTDLPWWTFSNVTKLLRGEL